MAPNENTPTKGLIVKFQVDNNGLGTYEVKLHWETKAKIKKIAFYGALSAVSFVSTLYVINKNEDASD